MPIKIFGKHFTTNALPCIILRCQPRPIMARFLRRKRLLIHGMPNFLGCMLKILMTTCEAGPSYLHDTPFLVSNAVFPAVGGKSVERIALRAL